MKRRDFIAGLVAASATPFTVSAQNALPMRRIAFLSGFPRNAPQTATSMTAFREGLNAVGLEEGRNIQIEYRWAGIDPAETRVLARELIALRPDLIVTSTNQVTSIVAQETQSIPILFVFIGDPIGSGYAVTLAKPGKNLTGFANFEAPIGGKWLELLKEISPQAKRVGFMHHPAVNAHTEFLVAAQASAPSFGQVVVPIPVTNLAEIKDGISNFAAAGANGGIVVPPHALTVGASAVITELATSHKLPGVYGDRIFSERGGLLSFGINPHDQHRRAADYVRRILNGEKAGDLPVQLPIKYELILNLKTANGFGLTVPPTLLARADEVIE
jgi:putative tryptophan/tyrosine transport system substrate-binding protein